MVGRRGMAGGLKEKVAPGDGATWFVRLRLFHAEMKLEAAGLAVTSA